MIKLEDDIYNKKDNLFAIWFLATWMHYSMGIYIRMKAVYSEYSYFHLKAVELCNKFWQGRNSINDLSHSGHACVAASDENVWQLEISLHDC